MRIYNKAERLLGRIIGLVLLMKAAEAMLSVFAFTRTHSFIFLKLINLAI